MLAASCSSGSGDPSAGDGRAAAVYEVVLTWIFDQEADATEPDPDQVIFVATRSEEPIDIDVQASVVEAFEGVAFVRFIDGREEAVDAEAERQTVRDGGILVGLGAVAQDTDTVEVYVDRYRSADDVAAWLVTVSRAGDAWDLSGNPEPADVRPLSE